MRKGISPVIGGWVVEVRTAKDEHNSIIAINPKFVPFY
jgi:hypothetical protein